MLKSGDQAGEKIEENFKGSQTTTIARPETVQRQKNRGLKSCNSLILFNV
jgi:hypothetical protein